VSALHPADAAKFSKIIALFSSNHTGEQLAALNRASAFLSSRSIGWPDIAQALVKPPVIYSPPPQQTASRSHQQDALRCLSSAINWTYKEHRFLIQMSNQRGAITDRQQAWIDGLVDRVARYENRRAA
jgi:hypothetical protein